MAASARTITDVYMVLQRHLSLSQRTRILADLAEVKGNASFTATVRALKFLHDRLLKETQLAEANEKALG